MIAWLFLGCLIAGTAYRIRGGGWFTLTDDIYCRLVWGSAASFSYLLIQGPKHAKVLFSIVLVGLGVIMELIPHPFCQNMGRWPSPQKRWPAFFLPTLTGAEWSSLPMWARTLYDYAAMTAVSFLRGLIVFGAYAIILWMRSLFYAHEFTPWPSLCGIFVITLLQPLGYLIGWYMPITLTSSITKRSTEWGEFLNGVSWALAFWSL